MKSKVFLIFVSLSCIFLFSSFENISINDVESREDKVRLSRIGGTTRSTSDFVVEASTDSKSIVNVSVMNYTGTAVVQIIGGRTSIQRFIDVNEMGSDVIRIGTLRPATYTIRIILDNVVYEGTFVKEYVGR